MVDYTERVQRLRVLWNRGRNIYTSFYTELDEARKEVGDDQFANWCFWELHISLDILNTTAGILKAADAAVVKREWKAARAAEKTQRKADREAEAAGKMAARQQRAEPSPSTSPLAARIEALEAENRTLRAELRQRETPSPATAPSPAECVVCGKPLFAARATRRYCSDRCRVAAYRDRARHG